MLVKHLGNDVVGISLLHHLHSLPESRRGGSRPTTNKFVARVRDSEGQGKMNVEHEINLLKREIKRLGTKDEGNHITVTFGTLFNDDECANIFEALVGTLRAAKRKKIVKYDGELLLQGVHDKVVITLQEE